MATALIYSSPWIGEYTHSMFANGLIPVKELRRPFTYPEDSPLTFKMMGIQAIVLGIC